MRVLGPSPGITAGSRGVGQPNSPPCGPTPNPINPAVPEEWSVLPRNVASPVGSPTSHRHEPPGPRTPSPETRSLPGKARVGRRTSRPCTSVPTSRGEMHGSAGFRSVPHDSGRPDSEVQECSHPPARRHRRRVRLGSVEPRRQSPDLRRIHGLNAIPPTPTRRPGQSTRESGRQSSPGAWRTFAFPNCRASRLW